MLSLWRVVRPASGSRGWVVFCLAIVVVACGCCSLGVGSDARAQLVADRLLDEPAEDAIQPGPNEGEEAICGPRELLQMLGIDDSHFDLLADGRPWQAGEDEILMRVMFRFRDGRFPLADIERWARGKFDLAELVENPDAARGQIYRLAGRAISVEIVQPSPEMAARFEFERYYRCRLLLGERKQPAIVFTPAAPRAWQVSAGRIEERASALGLFLKLAAGEVQEPLPVFVAPRVAWHPPGLLGDLGMDVGLLDGLEDQKGLTLGDREGFYQMLAAVGRAEPGELLREANRQLARTGEERFSVVPLFNQARQQRGRLVALRGRARRVTKIRVSDPDILARFGIDHYYEIGMFTEDSGGNPITFCVRELPRGMPTGDDPQFGELITVAGFYFKKWVYRVPRPADAPIPKDSRLVRMQPSPLLIGRKPLWHLPEDPAANTLAATIAGGLFVLALLGIWFALWRNSRSDKRFHDKTIAKARRADSAALLEKLSLRAEGTADFSRLEDAQDQDSNEGGGSVGGPNRQGT